jgi:2-haloacid dehalogenase
MHAPFSRTRICVFDAYGTLFDFNSAVARHRDAIGSQADKLSELWRTKQIQYTWLRSLMGVYDPFWTVTREALDHSMAALGVDGVAIADRLMDAYRALDAFAEVPAMLDAIAAMGVRAAILSNGDPGMLRDAVHNAGLDGRFEALLSVDEVRIYKVARPAYQLVRDRLAVAANEVCFLSSNCWDAHGAAHFGFDVAWVNRAGAPDDRLPGRIAIQLRDLSGLPDLLREARAG